MTNYFEWPWLKEREEVEVYDRFMRKITLYMKRLDLYENYLMNVYGYDTKYAEDCSFAKANEDFGDNSGGDFTIDELFDMIYMKKNDGLKMIRG